MTEEEKFVDFATVRDMLLSAQERRNAAFNAAPLAAVRGASAAKQQRRKRLLAVEKPLGAPEMLEVKWIHESQDRTVYESVVLMAACN